jgi:hypothetical protein
MRRLAILLVAAAAASACGSSGSSKSLTKTEYVSKANDLCKIYKMKLQSDAQATRGLTNFQERAKFDRATFVKDFNAQVAALKALHPPKADKKQIDAAIKQLQSAGDDLDTKLKNDPQAAYAPTYDPFRTAYNGLKKYGTTDCG